MEKSRRSTLQVALACSLGAFACGIIAIATGFHIGFGIVTGLVVGYLAYDFRSVLNAIPAAFGEFAQWANEKRLDLVEFKSALTPSAVVSLAIAACVFGPLAVRKAVAGYAGTSALAGISIVVGAVTLTGFLYIVTTLLAAVGTEFVEKARIVGSLNDEFAGMSYARFWTLVAKGSGFVLAFLLWRAEIRLIVGFCEGVVDVVKGLWKLFVLIHRYERVLCAIDGTLGGVIAYALLIGPERSFLQNAVAVLFGMVLGVGWGLLNYEIVSKRILKVVPVAVSAGAQ